MPDTRVGHILHGKAHTHIQGCKYINDFKHFKQLDDVEGILFDCITRKLPVCSQEAQFFLPGQIINKEI